MDSWAFLLPKTYCSHGHHTDSSETSLRDWLEAGPWDNWWLLQHSSFVAISKRWTCAFPDISANVSLEFLEALLHLYSFVVLYLLLDIYWDWTKLNMFFPKGFGPIRASYQSQGYKRCQSQAWQASEGPVVRNLRREGEIMPCIYPCVTRWYNGGLSSTDPWWYLYKYLECCKMPLWIVEGKSFRSSCHGNVAQENREVVRSVAISHEGRHLTADIAEPFQRGLVLVCWVCRFNPLPTWNF